MKLFFKFCICEVTTQITEVNVYRIKNNINLFYSILWVRNQIINLIEIKVLKLIKVQSIYFTHKNNCGQLESSFYKLKFVIY